MYIFFNKLFRANQMTKADNRLWGSQCGTFYQFGWVYPLTSISDQKRISPYNNNTISSRQVMRLKNCWSRTKFSEKNIIRIVWKTVRRITWWVPGSKRAKIIRLGLSSNAYPVKFWMWPKGVFYIIEILLLSSWWSTETICSGQWRHYRSSNLVITSECITSHITVVIIINTWICKFFCCIYRLAQCSVCCLPWTACDQSLPTL